MIPISTDDVFTDVDKADSVDGTSGRRAEMMIPREKSDRFFIVDDILSFK